jgi:hypothetical protein
MSVSPAVRHPCSKNYDKSGESGTIEDFSLSFISDFFAPMGQLDNAESSTEKVESSTEKVESSTEKAESSTEKKIADSLEEDEEAFIAEIRKMTNLNVDFLKKMQKSDFVPEEVKMFVDLIDLDLVSDVINSDEVFKL